tara:strand:+ start:337 stop:1611 length:1275 start_codon:yes stop_codon:yes gene_type:complete
MLADPALGAVDAMEKEETSQEPVDPSLSAGQMYASQYGAPTPPPQATIGGEAWEKEQEDPWYENLIQGDKPTPGGDFALPSVPTWRKFETSKIGKAINARLMREDKDKAFASLGYEKGRQLEGTVDAANWLPYAGEAIDATRAMQDLADKDYSGAALNAVGFVIPFLPGGIVKKGVKKLADKLGLSKEKIKTGVSAADMEKMNFINNASDAQIKASKNLSDADKVEILNLRVDTKMAKEAAEGGTVSGKKFYKGAVHYGKVEADDFYNVTSDVYSGIKQMGKATDEALAKINFNVATDLKPENVKRIGTQGKVKLKDGRVVERGIYEVTYPDGSKQKYWRSTSGGDKMVTLADGTKVSSEGYFGTVAGHMDAPPGVLGEPGSKSFKEGVDGWFIKGQEWQGYGSKTYKETGAALKEMFDSGLIK